MTDTRHKLQILLNELGIHVHEPGSGLLYKYCSLDTAFKIISSNSLKFSHADQFNDPFDMTSFLIDKTCTQEQVKDWIERVAIGSSVDRKMFIENYMNVPEQVNQLIDNALQNLKNEAGVSCFSKSYLKTLMWSHYADKHSGACLGFDFFPTNHTNNLMIMSVSYIDKVRRLNFFQDREVLLFHWLFTKSHIWSYEEEVRAFISTQNGLIPFDKRSLREIYLGVRVPPSKKDEMHQFLVAHGYRDVKISSLKIDFETFDLAEAPK